MKNLINEALKVENIDYFDSKYQENKLSSNQYDVNSLTVSVDRHVFYRDVYVFVNRLKNMMISKSENKIKKVISTCLREVAQI